MTRRFAKTISFAAGELDNDLHYRTDIPEVRNGSKVMRNFIPYAGGAARTRWSTKADLSDWTVLQDYPQGVTPASIVAQELWASTAEDSRFIPWIRDSFEYAVQIEVIDDPVHFIRVGGNITRLTYTGYKSIRIRVIDLSDPLNPIIAGDGVNFSDREFEFIFIPVGPGGGPTSQIDPAQTAGAVQVGNDMFITLHGLPPIRIFSTSVGTGVGMEVLDFYEEKTGTDVTMTNGAATVVGTGTKFDTEYAPGDIFRILGEDFTVNTVGSPTAMTITTNWTLDTATISRPPGKKKYVTASGFTTIALTKAPFSPKDVAFFQNRFVFINDFGTTDGDECRVVVSSAYDPYVIVPAPSAIGPVTDAPFDGILRIGQEKALQWVRGGDTIVIGGQNQEYGLANPSTAFSEGNIPTFRVIGTYGSAARTNATQYNGKIIFAPRDGGLVEINYSNENDNYATHNLSSAHKELNIAPRSIAVLEATSVDPVRRIFVTQNPSIAGNNFSIGSAYDDGQVSWTPASFEGLQIKEVIQLKGQVYFFVWSVTDARFQIYRWLTGRAAFAAGYSYDGWVSCTLSSTSTSPSGITTETWATPNLMHVSATDLQVIVSRNGKIIAEGDMDVDGSGEFEVVTPFGGHVPTAVRIGTKMDCDLQPIFPGSADELGESFNRRHRILSVRVRYTESRQLTINDKIQLPAPLFPSNDPEEMPELEGVAHHGLLAGWNEDTEVSIKPASPYSMKILSVAWEVSV